MADQLAVVDQADPPYPALEFIRFNSCMHLDRPYPPYHLRAICLYILRFARVLDIDLSLRRWDDHRLNNSTPDERRATIKRDLDHLLLISANEVAWCQQVYSQMRVKCSQIQANLLDRITPQNMGQYADQIDRAMAEFVEYHESIQGYGERLLGYWQLFSCMARLGWYPDLDARIRVINRINRLRRTNQQMVAMDAFLGAKVAALQALYEIWYEDVKERETHAPPVGAPKQKYD